jgi:hypothetical protein
MNVVLLSASLSINWNDGMTERTGVPQVKLARERARPTEIAVNSFELDPRLKRLYQRFGVGTSVAAIKGVKGSHSLKTHSISDWIPL